MNATKDNVQVGTVITYAYEWNSRHPKFVRVIKRTPSSVRVEELRKIILSHDGYGQNGSCIADLESEGIEMKGYFRFKKNGRLCIDGQPCYIYTGEPELFYTD